MAKFWMCKQGQTAAVINFFLGFSEKFLRDPLASARAGAGNGFHGFFSALPLAQFFLSGGRCPVSEEEITNI